MIYLLFYDISNNKIRTKIAKLLISEGFERIQFSVYTSLKNPEKNETLWTTLLNLTETENDAKIYVIALTKNNFKNIKIIGNFDFDIDYLTGEKRSLTF